ncbi:MAG: hypothetical protein LQ344_003543 [Seirophora lacunosa]|nr:MAG: hypothetical protein LQ344_003543 [Seirophora lacunosa]
MATLARQQPHWQPPPPPSPDDNVELPPLAIWNSLTRSKTPFIPLDWKNRRVTWYVCGPTVYDDAHLGHARNYVSTDIIRRIMKDYFKFHVTFVMNITDVDDKIIVRGRQQHLLEEFNDTARRKGTATVEETCLAALKAYISKNLPLLPSETAPEEVSKQVEEHYDLVINGKSLDGGVPGDKEAKIKMHIKTALAASEAMTSLKTDPIPSKDFNDRVQDILLPYLDSLYGSTINANDHSIFTKLTKKFEDRFMEDVRALNCVDPDVVTRVTEYGQQIVDFVGKVEKNGFAYRTSDGSVYFDIEAFEAANNNYARLEPWNRNDKDLQADGEGALTKKSSEKRSDADFALWKSSKPGEPSWPSPWGNGRPGWHIECSAMASDKLGCQIDIHSGGVDLAFPHHDNELAQSEAYWCDKGQQTQHQWVNYFMHMGHLSIQGSKMSKSLKNFTTIREALGRGDWTPRGLRIVFLLGGWREGIEITDDLVKEGSSWEDKVNNFFIKMSDMLDKQPSHRRVDPQQADSQQEDPQTAVWQPLQKARTDVFDALCDSFNTPSAMRAISELVSDYNSADKAALTIDQLLATGRWVTSITNMFGLNGRASISDPSIGWSGIDVPQYAKPYLTSISQLRDSLRQQARSSSNKLESEQLKLLASQPASSQATEDVAEAAPYQKLLSTFCTDVSALGPSPTLSQDILQLCDRIRDVHLWDLGIYLEDRADGAPSLIRPVTKELRAAKANEKAQQEAREQAKRLALAERGKAEKAKEEKGRVSHLEMFKTGEWSAWDEDGVPVKDKEGVEVTKSRGKKLRKEWERQRKVHEAWREANGLGVP